MLILGCGEIGRRVSSMAHPERQIYAVVSRPESAQILQRRGVSAFAIDFDEDVHFPGIPHQAQWFYFVPPQKSGEEDRRLKKWLACIPDDQHPARVVYISSSGVYGDHQGHWVTEKTPIAPHTERARRRAHAEQQWTHWCNHREVDLIVLRVPGIVGTGRSTIDRLKAGEPILHPDDAPYVNLIDADRLADICLSLSARAPAGIYNVANNEAPITITEQRVRLCKEEGIRVPQFIRMREAEKVYSPMRMSFIRESRRLNIEKLKSVYQF